MAKAICVLHGNCRALRWLWDELRILRQTIWHLMPASQVKVLTDAVWNGERKEMRIGTI